MKHQDEAQRHNESVAKRLHDIHRKASQLGVGVDATVNPEIIEIHFLCECTDAQCPLRVILNANEYQRIHQSGVRYVVNPDCDAAKKASVLEKFEKYFIVSWKPPLVPA